MAASMDLNVYSALHATNAFLPLILAGEQKKIIYISTGMADIRISPSLPPQTDTDYAPALALKCEIPFAIGYASSKAALNMLVTKYAVEYKPQDVKFLSMSPGWVKTAPGTEMNKKSTAVLLPFFQKGWPEVEDKISVEESVGKMLMVIDALTLEGSGRFVTHNLGEREGYWF